LDPRLVPHVFRFRREPLACRQPSAQKGLRFFVAVPFCLRRALVPLLDAGLLLCAMQRARDDETPVEPCTAWFAPCFSPQLHALDLADDLAAASLPLRSRRGGRGAAQ